jgi:dTDP-4-dehydrorhamnose reductase
MKILILGHTGMLGHMVKMYLEQFYTVETISDRWGTEEFKTTIQESDADYLINCIGAIPQRTKNFDINWELPIWLDQNFNGRIIHPGTDCEMDDDDYGISKAKAAAWLMENGLRTKIIKTSIIGYEVSGNASLMEWFLSNEDESTVNGYADHLWNGSTTYQWAKHSKIMIENWSKQMGLTIIGTSATTKYDMLVSINSVFDRHISVNKVLTGSTVNKCLDWDINYGHIKDQILEMKKFYDGKNTETTE